MNMLSCPVTAGDVLAFFEREYAAGLEFLAVAGWKHLSRATGLA